MEITVNKIAEAFTLKLKGGNPNAKITSVANIDEAIKNQLSFISLINSPEKNNIEKIKEKITKTSSTAIILHESFLELEPSDAACLLFSKDPEIDFIKCINFLYPEKKYPDLIHKKSEIDESAQIDVSSYIDAFVVINKNVKIVKY